MKHLIPSLILVVFCACLMSFTTDVYTPSLLTMADDLMTTHDMAQWTLAVYLIAVGLSQLVYGPLSEYIGRKPPIIIGLAIMSVGSVMAVMSTSINELLIARTIQGIGAGAASALWRTICRDVFEPKDFARVGSYMASLIVLIFPVAPVIGGYLESYGGWRASFYLMAGLTTFAFLMVILFVKETNKDMDIEKARPKAVLTHYLTLLKSPIFVGVIVSIMLTNATLFAWVITYPIIMMDQLGVSPIQFGWNSFMATSIFYISGSLLNGKLIKAIGFKKLMYLGWSVMMVSSGVILTCALLDVATVPVMIVTFGFIYFGSTFIWANAVAIAFAPFGHIAGYAGALYGALQLGSAGLISGYIAHNKNDTPLFVGATGLLMCLIAIIVFHYFVMPKIKED